MVLCVFLCLAMGYLLGCIQTGFIIGKINHIDIRDYGSGNSGTTNALRTLGKTAALLTFLGDSSKGLIAVNIARYILIPQFGGMAHEATLWLVTGFAVVIGHNFPFYLHFKGGKGIATTGGVIFAFDWRLGLLCLLIFSVVTGISKYVSLGSICMVLVIPFILYFSSPHDWQLVAVGCVFTAMAVWRHRANIGRLIHGTENKLGQKVKR